MTPRVPLGRVLADTGRQYWGSTSVSGLSNAHSADWRPLRLIWLGLFVVGLVFTVMDVFDVISDYFDYPHSTKMDVVYDKSAHFPAVTVCSQSRIDCERLLNASLHAPHMTRLTVVLRKSDCLKEEGLNCPYVWALAAGMATKRWIATHKPACLQCDQCERLQRRISKMRLDKNKEGAKLYEDLFVVVGCSTTCSPPDERKGGAEEGSTKKESPDAAQEEMEKKEESVKRREKKTKRSKEKVPDSDGQSPDEAGEGVEKREESVKRREKKTKRSKEKVPDSDGQSPDEAEEGVENGEESVKRRKKKTKRSKQKVPDSDGQSPDEAGEGVEKREGSVKRRGKKKRRRTGEEVQSQGDTTGAENEGDGSGTNSAGAVADGSVLRTRAKRATKKKRKERGARRRKKLDPSSFEASQFYDDSMQSLLDFMILTEDQRISIGIAREDFIKECTYLGTSCNNELLFRTVSSPQFGNCFTFNTNVTETSDPLAGERVTGLTGEHFSLDLLLDIKHHSFPPVVATKGARVQVHQPDHQPDVEDSGISVLPNTATSFAIEQLTIQRLPYPYAAKCISSWEQAEFSPNSTDNEESRESYSVTRCKKMCLQGLFMERCGCCHTMYPTPGSFRRREHPRQHAQRPCLLTVKGKDSQCTADIQKQFDNGTLKCHCPSACYEKTFNVFQSMAEWPRDTYVDTAAGRMNIDVRELTKDTRRELASNILEVKVFFKTLNTATLRQYPEYSFGSFLSSLGGAMSLYLGVSAIMVAEILEFFCLLGRNLYRRDKGRYVSSVTPESVKSRNVGDVKKVAIKPNGIEIAYVGDVRRPVGYGSPPPPKVD